MRGLLGRTLTLAGVATDRVSTMGSMHAIEPDDNAPEPTPGAAAASATSAARQRGGGRRQLDRELAWLDFNARVLFEASDARNALLDRVRFLAIFASNLDEFFQVRVSGLRQQVRAEVGQRLAN